MPANVIALVMKAEAGAELTCRAHNYHFEHAGSPQERGVISYYAGQTLAQATTFAAWLQHIEALSSTDFREERLPWFYQLPSSSWAMPQANSLESPSRQRSTSVRSAAISTGSGCRFWQCVGKVERVRSVSRA